MEQVICKSCRTIHDKVPLLKKHTLTKIQHVDGSVSNLSTSCRTHGEEYVHFCENEECKCLTCSVCATSDHKGHAFVDIESISNKERERLKVTKDKLQSKVQTLSGSIDDIMSTQIPGNEKDCNEYLQRVEHLATELNNMIKLVTEKEITKIHDFQLTEKQHLQDSLENLERMHTEYQNVIQKIDERHNIIFMNLKKAAIDDIEKLDCIPNLHPRKKFELFNEGEIISNVVEQLQSRYTIRLITEKDKEINVLQTKLVTEQNSKINLEKDIKRLKEDNKIQLNRLNQNKDKIIKDLEQKLATEQREASKLIKDKSEEINDLKLKIEEQSYREEPNYMNNDQGTGHKGHYSSMEEINHVDHRFGRGRRRRRGGQFKYNRGGFWFH